MAHKIRSWMYRPSLEPSLPAPWPGQRGGREPSRSWYPGVAQRRPDSHLHINLSGPKESHTYRIVNKRATRKGGHDPGYASFKRGIRVAGIGMRSVCVTLLDE
jgi:hypothetical protein